METFEEHRKSQFDAHGETGCVVLFLTFVICVMIALGFFFWAQFDDRLDTLEQAYQTQMQEMEGNDG